MVKPLFKDPFMFDTQKGKLLTLINFEFILSHRNGKGTRNFN